jgi:hypothetical protein
MDVHLVLRRKLIRNRYPNPIFLVILTLLSNFFRIKQTVNLKMHLLQWEDLEEDLCNLHKFKAKFKAHHQTLRLIFMEVNYCLNKWKLVVKDMVQLRVIIVESLVIILRAVWDQDLRFRAADLHLQN